MKNVYNQLFLTIQYGLLLVIFFLAINGHSQTYLGNTTSTPVTYNTCGGMFYDNGGASGNYSVSINNRVTTLCSNDGTSAIKVDFTAFNVEFSYDKLYIYDGPNTSSPLVVLLSGNISPGTFISTGTCLTFKFYSDGYYPFSGWEAIISCVEKPSCVSNPAASNICSSATFINNLNGYCGNTSSSYSPDSSPDLLTEFCGSIENNSWLRFTASSTSASFNVWTSNCTVGDGIQIQIYSTSDCLSFNPVSNCWNNLYDSNGTITATGLTPGQDYFMMIDGTDGDVCNYLIGGESGFIMLPVEDFKLSVECDNGNAFIEWSLNKNEKLTNFNIEKSLDGISFSSISEIKNTNNNSNRSTFQFTDLNSNLTPAYYRIKMTDIDGQISSSDIVYFDCENQNFNVYPNPGSNFITILCDAPNNSIKSIKIVDALGQLVQIKNYDEQKTSDILDISELSSGIYTIILVSEKSIQSKKFTKI